MSIATYIKICELNRSGNLAMYLIDVENITSVTVTDGEVSEIILFGGSSFKKIDADINSIKRLQDIQENGAAKSYLHSINFTASILRTETNNLSTELRNSSRCGIAAIVIDANGKSWLVGWNTIEQHIRALYLKNENKSSIENVVSYTLESLSEFQDLPLDAALNTHVIDAFYDGETELFFISTSLLGEDEFVLLGEEGIELVEE